MDIVNFSRASKRYWDDYLDKVAIAAHQGRLASRVSDGITLYPQSMLITDMPEHMAMELIGVSRSYRPLRLQRHQSDSVESYVGQFRRPACTSAFITFADPDPRTGSSPALVNLAIRSVQNEEELERRFPGLSAHWLTHLVNLGAESVPVALRTSASLYINECLFVNQQGPAVRIRHLKTAAIVSKSTSEYDYIRTMGQTATMDGDLWGVLTVPDSQVEAEQIAGQFANAFLLDRLAEVPLSTFLDDHRSILLGALGGMNMIAQPRLRWQVPSSDSTEIAIQPDCLIQRSDGFWDVYDFKLPLLERSKLTKGERRRRRVHRLRRGRRGSAGALSGVFLRARKLRPRS